MIETYVKSCVPCQLHKIGDNRPIRKKMTPRRGRVFGLVCSDIFGPIKVSRGYEYVISFIDMVSKYIELVPLKKIDSGTVSRVFLNRVVLRYGAPDMLMSDNGPQYISSVLKNLAELLGTKASI